MSRYKKINCSNRIVFTENIFVEKLLTFYSWFLFAIIIICFHSLSVFLYHVLALICYFTFSESYWQCIWHQEQVAQHSTAWHPHKRSERSYSSCKASSWYDRSGSWRTHSAPYYHTARQPPSGGENIFLQLWNFF